MRRKDRELTDRAGLEAILKAADVCRLAINTGGAPYIVPLNFGYAWDAGLVLYFHGAGAGRKWELLEKDPRVGFELDVGHELVDGETACDWGMRYQSLVGSGRVRVVDEDSEKRSALDAIMSHYGFKGRPEYSERMMEATRVFAVEAAELAGKRKA